MIQNREMMFRYAVVMAAGEGRRLYSLTAGFPKALIDVKGKHLISWSLNQILLHPLLPGTADTGI
ncbi:MAG: 2-C-methyl-D-erythritol 4-phosphate cytidylyltransferase [Dysgonamonadaceae bacterium]|jgi:choline kinase|nr:2-C-methyl-D-erythritol 4-phosphate cytidylyltransferase [Dysgonamonadaceae bacterium]